MAIHFEGEQIRRIRGAFGLTATQFATVLGVHPSTVNRWEMAGTDTVPVDGVAANVLVGLQRRLAEHRSARSDAAKVGQAIGEALLVGGALVGLAILLEWLVQAKK